MPFMLVSILYTFRKALNVISPNELSSTKWCKQYGPFHGTWGFLKFFRHPSIDVLKPFVLQASWLLNILFILISPNNCSKRHQNEHWNYISRPWKFCWFVFSWSWERDFFSTSLQFMMILSPFTKILKTARYIFLKR